MRAVWPWLAGAAVAGGVALVAALLPDQPAPVPISADLTHAGAARITFEKALGATTSPTCGCLRSEGHRPPGGWQGVVVPARELTVQRVGDDVPTRYDIFNAEPAVWSDWPSYLGIETHVGVAVVPADRRPTRRDMLTPTLLVPFERVVTDILSLKTRGALHVASFGDEPVAAVGVQRGAMTRIAYRTPARRPEDRTLRVTAPFAAAWSPEVPTTDEGPLLDVLGPQVLLWAPLDTKLHYTKAVLMAPPPFRGGPGGYDGAYQAASEEFTRLSVPRGKKAYVLVTVPAGAYAVRVMPRPVADDADLASDATWSTPSKLVVTVPRAVSQAQALVPVFHRAEARPRTIVDEIPFMTSSDLIPGERSVDMTEKRLWYRDAMPFDRPPTPPVSGVNVFGEIDDLRLEDVRGHVTAGARQISLAGRTDLELRHITGHGVDGDRLLIPVQIDAGTAQIYVKGQADARLNGTPLATRRHVLVDVFSGDTLMLVAAIAAALLGGVGAVRVRTLRA